ncbi:hypothetical protein [Actinomyces minihominis]|uniref:hypothetical protein n=1 Tax=Actinomyces minihominis TaxID=2002838 RepID=UPI00101AE692|nr:hypothetical protein [Actinomyces minihominis]
MSKVRVRAHYRGRATGDSRRHRDQRRRIRGQRFTAVVGILIALALVGGAVAWLYRDVYRQAWWSGFVRDSATSVLDAVVLVEQSETTLITAQTAQLGDDSWQNLQNAITATEATITKGEELAEFLIPEDDEAAGVGEEKPDTKPLNPREALVVLKSAKTYSVAMPQHRKEAIAHFHALNQELTANVVELREAKSTVEDKLSETLRSAGEAWQAAFDDLNAFSMQALTVLQQATQIPQANEIRAVLWTQFRTSQGVLLEAQEVDSGDVKALEASAEALTAEAAATREAFAPYMDEQGNFLLPPELLAPEFVEDTETP